ncbi:efflux RND transporter periplasmic adaptor subunit [Xanthomonadaceae bacterium JHOS43]|nr:efflux RND transporter periplasmic adaptor subunit [Xanthomonadaceae bacterium JHOS43]
MLVLLVLLLLLLLPGCGGSTDDPAAGEGADASTLAVSLAPVEREVLAREIVASGMVAAWEDMPLGVEVSGLRVADVLVEVGQAVKAGDVLLKLDDRAARSDAAQVRAALLEAQAALELADANLARGRQMRERALLSAADFDQLRATRAQAQARVGSARAALDAAELRLSYTTLRAPDDGVISHRSTQPGAVVSSGVALLGLMRQNRLEWRAQVSEAELSLLAIGQKVRLRAHDGSVVEARIRAVAPGLDAATRTALLHADLPEPGAFRAGMVAEGRIAVGEATTLTVPVASIVRRDGYAYAFSVDAQGRVSRHRVEVGGIADGRIEVLSGLDEGDQVVDRGAGFLGEGDRVRVVAGTAVSP